MEKYVMFSYLFIYTLKNNGFTGNSVKIFLFISIKTLHSNNG